MTDDVATMEYSTDYERTVLEHYQLTTPYPLEWPEEKDLSDASDEEEEPKATHNRSKSIARKSRFSVLERNASRRRSFVPGAQLTGDGVENLVQKDEPDPLGSTLSVVRMLKESGLPVSDDAKLRNRFLLSSTTFSPALFLAQVHSGATTSDLLRGRDVLSQSIAQKSASLKILVESEFERFVRATSIIDSVYNEMKNQGVDPNQPKPRPHSRHASRNSVHLRSGSNGIAANAILNAPPSPTINKKKNALLKESEYGVLGIKAPLVEVAAKAEEVWGPALGGREKEEKMKTMVSSFDRCKENFELATAISDSIKRKDYESLVEEYARAKRFSDEAKTLADTLLASRTSATDAQIHQILAASRMWHDVQDIVGQFKRDVQRRLVLAQSKSLVGGTDPMELISILLELGVDENPIWIWLSSRYEGLRGKIAAFSERSRVEIEIMRRRLGTNDRPPAQAVRGHLRSVGRQGIQNKTTSLDSADVIEFWEKMVSFLTRLLSPDELLGEVVDFWQTAQGFIEGKTQKTLPLGVDGDSVKHRNLTEDDMLALQNGTVELVEMIRETVYSFFADPPVEDISALFSPLPSTPRSPPSAVAPSMTPTALRVLSTVYDGSSVLPPSSRRGEAWEKFAFWPPWSNSLSASHYLAKLLVLTGSAASQMAAIRPVAQGDAAVLERLRGLVGSARERCVTAICAAWNKDAENIKVLEDWQRSHEQRDITQMPASFEAFETAILLGMQKVLYVSEAMIQPGASEMVFPPPAKLLQIVRNQFVTTLYKALAGMVENSEKLIAPVEDDWLSDLNGLASPVVSMAAAKSIGAGTVNASDRNVRMLLTLSNLQALRVNIVPGLTTQFENAFSVKLTDETKTIRDVLGQIDARLFQSYTRPAVETLHAIIEKGVLGPHWCPGTNERPREVRPYVYEGLLSVVLIHTQVATTTTTLTAQVMSYILEQFSRELLAAFSQRPSFNLPALMQATLDIEFVAQTLSLYTTDRASEIQSQIYQQLDKGTDDISRQKLQSELPGMRGVLKMLREASRSEFACFRRPKK